MSESIHRSDPRSPEYFARFHERARTTDPDWVYRFTRVVLTPMLVHGFRARAIGVENVPESGGAILAPNHLSHADPFFMGVFLSRPVRFMAKSELFRPPFLERYLTHIGTFPVRRNQHDVDAIDTASAILDRGGLLCIYAEGTRQDSGRPGSPHRGVGRIALQMGVPVVPVTMYGTQRLEKARGSGVRWPKITVQFGEPITFPRDAEPSPEKAFEAAAKIFNRVVGNWDRLDALERGGAAAEKE